MGICVAWVIFGIQWKAPELIQHKLPLPYSLTGHKVIVGKGELVVVGDDGLHGKVLLLHGLTVYILASFLQSVKRLAQLIVS